MPGRGVGQPSRLGLPFLPGRLEPGCVSARSEVRSPATVNPASASRAERSAKRTSAAPSFAPIVSAFSAAPGGFGRGGLFLLAGHPLAAELAQLGMVERTADRAGGAVDEGGGELGAHSVDACHAQLGRFGEELGHLDLRVDVGLRLAAFSARA